MKDQTAMVDELRAQLRTSDAKVSHLQKTGDQQRIELAAMREERDRLWSLLNTPEIHDFALAVEREAAHQRARCGSDHDAGKTDADWFWLIGYLAGKALYPATSADERDKKLHRIITVAAAACNWHAAKLGQTNMRPGIETPAGEAP